MRFIYDGQTYGISFRREREEAPDHVVDNVDAWGSITRMMTTAFLHRQVGPKQWEEVGHASVTCNYQDQETRETGRLRALARLAPFIKKELRPLMFDAYFNRKSAVVGER